MTDKIRSLLYAMEQEENQLLRASFPRLSRQTA